MGFPAVSDREHTSQQPFEISVSLGQLMARAGFVVDSNLDSQRELEVGRVSILANDGVRDGNKNVYKLTYPSKHLAPLRGAAPGEFAR